MRVLGVFFVFFVLFVFMRVVVFGVGGVLVLQGLVQLGVQLAGLVGVVGGVDGVAGGDLGVMAGQLEVVFGVMGGGLAMVERGVLVMFGRGVVVILDGFVGGFD